MFTKCKEKQIIAAIRLNFKIKLFLFSILLYKLPQNIDAIIAVAVPAEVIDPICVPENPIYFKYWPIRGKKTPSAPYANAYRLT